MTLSNFMFAILICTPTLVVFALLIKFLRRKERAQRRPAMVEDPQALDAAQAQVNKTEFRREISQTHVLLDSYSSMQFYNVDYMEQLVAALAHGNIEAHYYFQESMPTGVITVVGPTGFYELYVPRGTEAEAKKIVDRFRQK